MLSHPGRKDKNEARVGHPLRLRRGREFCGLNDKKAGARPAFPLVCGALRTKW